MTDIDPGREASPQCLRALHLLHRHPQGLTATDLAALSEVEDQGTLRPVLQGLRDRGRVVRSSTGQDGRWLTRQHAREAGLPVPVLNLGAA